MTKFQLTANTYRIHRRVEQAAGYLYIRTDNCLGPFQKQPSMPLFRSTSLRSDSDWGKFMAKVEPCRTREKMERLRTICTNAEPFFALCILISFSQTDRGRIRVCRIVRWHSVIRLLFFFMTIGFHNNTERSDRLKVVFLVLLKSIRCFDLTRFTETSHFYFQSEFLHSEL